MAKLNGIVSPVGFFQGVADLLLNSLLIDNPVDIDFDRLLTGNIDITGRSYQITGLLNGVSGFADPGSQIDLFVF